MSADVSSAILQYGNVVLKNILQMRIPGVSLKMLSLNSLSGRATAARMFTALSSRLHHRAGKHHDRADGDSNGVVTVRR